MFERRHPWVFSGAIRGVRGNPADGDLIELQTRDGAFLARGYWNGHSQIRVHVLTWDALEPLDDSFWRARLERAVAARAGLAQGERPAVRLVHAESDGLPGLIVDRYADWLVVQALTAGIEARKARLAEMLAEIVPGVRGIYERSDVDIRGKEGLPAAVGMLAGEEPPPHIEIDEDGRRFLVDVRHGHKTGFYIDQRANRSRLAGWLRLTPGAEMLNAFSFSGGFAVAALQGGAARAINVDSSAEALALARRNVELNGFAAQDEDFVAADVFHLLRQYREAGRRFDSIVLDPPKFAHSQQQVQSATRGYKDINLLAFQLLRPGGLLFTFSCSGLVSADLFQKVVFGALADTGRDAQILERLGAGPDHPVALTFPEGEYLKGLVCRVW
ncbi:MAG: class I SAM-dependent rRNA methyltransferase [Anaerolineae bacterium]|nr:class I SAM-dependent rRNA methyltransferase [Anaerolineae bacterium]